MTNSRDFDLSGLNETLRNEVKTLIEEGRLTLCDGCPNFFDPTLTTKCPTCTAEAAKPKPKVRKATVSIVVCGNPECSKSFPEWRGKKYCKVACKSRTAQLKAKAKVAAAAAVVAATKPAPIQEASIPQATATPIGDTIGTAGASCPEPECQGELVFKRGRFGPFYGCSHFFKENRPAGVSKCRATARWTPGGPALPQPKPTPTPPAPVVQPQPRTRAQTHARPTDIAEKILYELKKLNGEIADCIGRVAALEQTTRGNNELVAVARKDISDLDDKVDSVLDILKALV